MPTDPAKPKRSKRQLATSLRNDTSIIDEVLDLLAAGRTLRSICRDKERYPSPASFLRWCEDDADLAKRYARARRAGMDTLADEIMAIADDGSADYIEREREDGSTYTVADTEHIQRSKLRVDTRKWLMSKLRPDLYGDRVTTELTGAGGGPIELRAQLPDLSKLSTEQLEQYLALVRAMEQPAQVVDANMLPYCSDLVEVK